MAHLSAIPHPLLDDPAWAAVRSGATLTLRRTENGAPIRNPIAGIPFAVLSVDDPGHLLFPCLARDAALARWCQQTEFPSSGHLLRRSRLADAKVVSDGLRRVLASREGCSIHRRNLFVVLHG